MHLPKNKKKKYYDHIFIVIIYCMWNLLNIIIWIVTLKLFKIIILIKSNEKFIDLKEIYLKASRSITGAIREIQPLN